MAAIANVYYEVTTADTHTGDTNFSDVPSAAIPSSDFVTGQKYLILVSCQSSLGVSSSNFRLQVVHGTTAFADSERSVQANLANTRLPYLYFTVWTAVSGEGIKLQHKVDVSSATVSTDQVVLFAMRLDADLTENTDWFYNENTTSNALGTTFEDGASVTWTPGTANDIWLLVHRQQLTRSAVTSQGETRADLSGGTADNWGLCSEEGELAANDIALHAFLRAISLPASSHTFKVQGRSESADVHTHVASAVFVLNLSKFKDVSQVFTATPVGYSATEWASAIQTLSHTKTVNGDVLILAANIDDPGATTTTATHRLQVDNADQPDTQTADLYPTSPTNNDSTDQSAFHIFTRESITANITIDHDGHSNVATTPTYEDRALVCFSMELAGAGATTVTPSAVAAAYAISTPSVVKGAITKTPSAVAAAYSVATPSLVRGGLVVTPNALAAVYAMATPSLLLGGVTKTPGAVVAAYTVATPSVSQGGEVLTPAAAAAAYSVIAPALVEGAVTITPGALSGSFVVATPSLLKGALILTPNPVTGAWSVQVPVVTRGGIILAPSPVVAVWTVTASSIIKGTRTLLPVPVGASWVVVTPVVEGGTPAASPADPSPWRYPPMGVFGAGSGAFGSIILLLMAGNQ